MLTLTIIKELVSIEKVITMKLLSVFRKQLVLNLPKPISIIIEDLHIERKESLTVQLKIMNKQLKLIQIISKHIIIERFAGTNLASMSNQSMIMRVQLICSQIIFLHYITWEPLERRLAEIS